MPSGHTLGHLPSCIGLPSAHFLGVGLHSTPLSSLVLPGGQIVPDRHLPLRLRVPSGHMLGHLPSCIGVPSAQLIRLHSPRVKAVPAGQCLPSSGKHLPPFLLVPSGQGFSIPVVHFPFLPLLLPAGQSTPIETHLPSGPFLLPSGHTTSLADTHVPSLPLVLPAGHDTPGMHLPSGPLVLPVGHVTAEMHLPPRPLVVPAGHTTSAVDTHLPSLPLVLPAGQGNVVVVEAGTHLPSRPLVVPAGHGLLKGCCCLATHLPFCITVPTAHVVVGESGWLTSGFLIGICCCCCC